MLTPCPRCHRHVRARAACPFCSRAAVGLSGPGLALAVGLAVSGCGGTATLDPEPGVNDGRSNGGETSPPPDEEIRTAPAYGAAPLPPEDETIRDAPAYGGAPSDDDPRPIAAYGAPPMPTTP